MAKQRILVSACLLGVNCRYKGDGQKLGGIEALMEHAELIPVCPEVYGGLPTPRTPAERCGDRVLMRDGTDVTMQFHRGAQEAVNLAKLFGAEYALLKERSPSCGAGEIYDGSFTGAKTAGNGVAAEYLMKNGVKVYGESRLEELIEQVKGEEK